jgi:hypothetical protein
VPVYAIVDERDATSFFICKIVLFSVEFLTKNLCKNVVFKTGKKILDYTVLDTDNEQSDCRRNNILLAQDHRNEFQATLLSCRGNGSSSRYDGERLAAYKAMDLTLESQQLLLGYFQVWTISKGCEAIVPVAGASQFVG